MCLTCVVRVCNRRKTTIEKKRNQPALNNFDARERDVFDGGSNTDNSTGMIRQAHVQALDFRREALRRNDVEQVLLQRDVELAGSVELASRVAQ